MQIGGYRKEYDFTVDLAFGHEAEQQLIDFFHAVQHQQVEVKADRYRNGRMAVEVQHNPHGQWLKSGLATTTATWWAYQTAPGAFLFVEVARLKRFITVNFKTLATRTFAEHSDCPAWGYLLMPGDVQNLMSDTAWD